MADYYTKFSLVLSLPDQDAQTYALELAHQACQGQQGDELPTDFPKALADVIEDWQFETDADSPAGEFGVWLHSDCGAWKRSAPSSNTCCRSSIPKVA